MGEVVLYLTVHLSNFGTLLTDATSNCLGLVVSMNTNDHELFEIGALCEDGEDVGYGDSIVPAP